MSAKKSQFLGAFGKAFQIFKAITDTVLDIGGNDEDVSRVLTDENLRKALAERILESRTTVVASSDSKVDAVLQRLEEKQESIEAPKRDFSAKINDAVNTFLIYIESDEGKKALRLMELTKRAVVISYTMDTTKTGCDFARHDAFQLQFDGFNRETSNSTYPWRGSNPSHGDGCRKNNLRDTEVISQFVREFCRKHNKQPEDFLPFVKKEVERIATEHE